MFPDGDVGRTHSNVLTSAASRAAGPTPRTGEKILVAYFVYLAVLASVRGLPATRILLAWLTAAAIFGLAWTAARRTDRAISILRDWIPLALILAGYWELQWFSSAREVPWQQTWLSWDQHLLNHWGLRSVIECLGPVIPSALEAAYLSVYAIPPICIAALYLFGKRERSGRFLTTLFLGGFSAYALLPLFPTVSPRLAFAGSDLPSFGASFRSANLYLLNRFDISTSVFPSGHVTVAFSSAFGLWRALPEKRWLAYVLIFLAVLVYMATIYSRYHYAVDGLAGFGIAVLAWLSSDWVEQHV